MDKSNVKKAKRAIVFYINVGNLLTDQIQPFLDTCKQKLDDPEEIHYYVPVRNTDSKIEMLWQR